jgi:arginine decarboxylase
MSTPEPLSPAAAPAEDWTTQDAEELYRIRQWSDSFFFVNDRGHMAVRPLRDEDTVIDIDDVVQDLRKRNVRLPVLLRFQDVLRARVVRLNTAFADAIAESGYQARYQGVYPIKVNQLHEVVQEVCEAGRPFKMGLECGSKTELIAALPHMEEDDSLLICNGYKDSVMLRLMLAAQQIGKNVVPVMEKYGEFEHFLKLAREVGQRPRLGVRVRLTTSGAGKWADSGGDQSKFGISIPELVTLMHRLKDEGLEDALVLLHFHLGSQIADVQILKKAVKEITQVYAQLIERGLQVRYLDCGGGLGVNYEAGYGGDDESSINYTLREYANAVVYSVKEVCDEEKVPHPILVSESGRALTAHHSVLIVEALGSFRKDTIDDGFVPTEQNNASTREMFEVLGRVRDLGKGNVGGSAKRRKTPPVYELLEAYHDAVEKRQESDSMFTLGYLPIEEKALVDRIYWSVCTCIDEQLKRANRPEAIPKELRTLDDHLVEQYLCDFSIFQSIIDHWGIGQRFPIVPIKGLTERPTRRAVLVDLTCDSDGKVSNYVSSNADKDFLEVHALKDDEPYHLGFFLMGAYQDIMGDSHNLFGRVTEAHIYADADEPGDYYIEKIIPGTTVQEMLAQVQYFPNDLHRRMNEIMRKKIDEGRIRPKAGVELLEQYMRCFAQSTYYEPHYLDQGANGGGS